MALLQIVPVGVHRSAAAKSAAAYTALVNRFAVSDPVLAVACQQGADMARVTAALWSMSSVTSDPESTFFRLASTVTARAVAVPFSHEVRPDQLVAAWRRAWIAAVSEANIPLAFPESSVRPGPVLDLALARSRFVGFAQVDEFVAAQYARGAALGGSGGLLESARGYLVAVASAAGDRALLSAQARWAWLESLASASAPLEEVRGHVRTVLGPVDAVRATEFLSI